VQEGRGEEGKTAGEQPYPTRELLRRLLEGKKRRSGGVTGGRSSAMAGGGRAQCTMVFWAKGSGCGLGTRARGRLNRGGQAPRRADPRPRTADVRAGLGCKSGPDLCRGWGRPRWAGLACQRE
jgi:hypothetical protein